MWLRQASPVRRVLAVIPGPLCQYLEQYRSCCAAEREERRVRPDRTMSALFGPLAQQGGVPDI